MRGLHVLGRTVSPAALVLALLCFLMPFIAVACDTPGGYGRVSQGGTTSYTAVDLATGGAPNVTPDQLLPEAQRRDDRLDWQPLFVLTALLVLSGLAANVGLRRWRAGVTAGVAMAAAVVLIGAQLRARSELVQRVAEQAGLSPSQAGKHVVAQNGFWLCLMLLLAAALAAVLEALLGQLRRPAAPDPPA